MSLSPSSYEILSDLLELRLETFLVTSSEEERERKMLETCQRELAGLEQMARRMAPAPRPAAKTGSPRISRRLQRLVRGLSQAEEAARAIA